MQPPFLLLALLNAFASSAQAALPAIFLDGSGGVSALLVQERAEADVCGPEHDNKICPANQCCSSAGNCGMGKGFCAVPDNCQPGFGVCDSDTTPAGYNTSEDSRPAIGSVQYGQTVSRCTVPRSIALTFDDGPTANTERLLDILKENNATATFFLSGNSQGKGPIDTTSNWTNSIKRMVKEGHQVASNGWSHFNLDQMDSQTRRVDMIRNERALANVLGKYPTYMRAPNLQCFDPQGCLGDMGSLGYHVISWSHDSGDRANPEDLDDMRRIADAAFNNTGAEDNMLMIQHDAVEASAVDLTRYILQKAQQKGWQAMSVGECLGDNRRNWFRFPAWTTPGTTSQDGCVVSDHDFCGQLPEFKNKEECFGSYKHCEQVAAQCADNPDIEVSNCQEMERLCNMEFLYCAQCNDSKDEDSETRCNIDDFKVSKLD